MSNTTENFTQAMWQNFVQKLNEGLGNPGLSYTTYIPTSGYSAANWELLDTTGTVSGKPGTIIVNNIESWCNNMPVWGASYIPGGNFYDNYALFLYSLKLGTPGDPAQQQIANAWSQKVQFSQQKINELNTNSAKAWSVFNTAQEDKAIKVSYAIWYQTNNEGPNKPNGPSWAKSLALETEVKKNALLQYQETLKKVGGIGFKALSLAIDALKLSATAGNVLTDEAGANWPKYEVNPGLNDWFVNKALINSTGTPQISFEIDMSTVTYNLNNKSDFVNQNKNQPFLTSGSGTNKTDLSTLIQNMKMTYAAQSAQLFSIESGTWFDQVFMNNYSVENGKGVYVVAPNSALANKELFGPTGIINLKTDKLLVVYRPTITLKGNSTDINSLKQAVKTTDSLSIGGLSFDASSMATDSTTNVTIASNDNTPVVIGIVSNRLG